MLIVVVIIGILAAAILPRITGYLAKTRDMKRQLDLRTIATAVQMYKDQKRELPKRVPKPEDLQKYSQNRWRDDLFFYGYASALQEPLAWYLSSIPKDPNSSNELKTHANYYHIKNNSTSQIFKDLWKVAFLKGEYHYQILPSRTSKERGAILVAKVEIPEYANYVWRTSYPGLWEHPIHLFSVISHYKNDPYSSNNPLGFDELYLCDKVGEKVSAWSEQFPTRDQRDCTYSNVDQLYYIVKIE